MLYLQSQHASTISDAHFPNMHFDAFHVFISKPSKSSNWNLRDLLTFPPLFRPPETANNCKTLALSLLQCWN